MEKPAYRTVTRTQGNNRALKTGEVTPRTCRLDFVEIPVLVDAFRMMVREQKFDICEMAITTYLCAKAYGKPFTAIPVFLVRGFHAGAIYVKRHGGISVPKDLEGQRIGVNRGYTVTTGVWARAALARTYGVDLSSITWVLSGDEHVTEYRPPDNVISGPKDKTLAQLLVNGDIAAAIGIEPNHPDIVPLIPDALDQCLLQLRSTGLYPINHLIVIRDDLIAAHPGLATDIFNAFAESKRRYVEQLHNNEIETPDAADRLNLRLLPLLDDPLPYGVAPNRLVLDMLVENALDQKIIPQAMKVEAMFVPETLNLKG
jgi:4,5-dihydroxyphthalate decarboxylase